MGFGLLGPFEVRAGGRRLEISSPMCRVLLATMLLRAGSPVPVGELVDAIWGEAPPGNPRSAVQLHVMRLRRLLTAPGSAGLINTSAGGYQIDVRPEQVDVWRFRQRLERATRVAEAGDLDAEATALTEALAQWRGEPLAGLPSELLQREVAPRLREQWLQAVDRRFNVELGRGRHEQIVSELFTLTAQYPLREPLWVQLMTALHRSGRRAEALGAYHSARRHLADELGVDPGAELQDLYATALAGVARKPDARAVAVPPVPRQLPAEVSTFVGRRAELTRLDALLDGHLCPASPMTVSVIAGMAGIGKTALAAHWARRAVDHFPDGQLWVNLRGFSPGQVITPGHALARFLRALDVQDAEIPLELDDQIGMYRSLMDGRRMLLVLDNASSAEQVRPLLPGAPGCMVVLTSRSQLSGLVAAQGAHPIVLDLLSPSEAHQLLAGRVGADRIRMQAEASEDIVRSCARLPLALAIVAARAAAHPEFGLDDLAAELRAARGSLDAFAVPDPAVEVRAVFSWSYQALSVPSARLFRLLGLHPGPDVALPAVASLAGLSVAQARPVLAELCDAHLITEHGHGRFACHDLLRSYATELGRRFDTAAERRKARLRMFDHYLLTAHAGSLLLQAWEPVTPAPPQPWVTVVDVGDHRQALSWFNAEHHVLLAVVQHAADTGFSGYGQQLAWTLIEYLYRQGHWHDWARTLQTALDAATSYADRAAQARLHRGLVRAYARMGRLNAAAAHGGPALDLAEEVGDKLGLAMTHRALGILREVQGRLSDALDHDLRALELFQAANDRRGEARTLNSVGWSYARLDDHVQALDYCKRALLLLTDLDDRQGVAATWDSLGYAHHRLGHYRQAVTCYRHAVRLFRDLGDRYKEAEGLTHLGDTCAAAGDRKAARAAWRTALDIYEDLGHYDAEGVRAKL